MSMNANISFCTHIFSAFQRLSPHLDADFSWKSLTGALIYLLFCASKSDSSINMAMNLYPKEDSVPMKLVKKWATAFMHFAITHG